MCPKLLLKRKPLRRLGFNPVPIPSVIAIAFCLTLELAAETSDYEKAESMIRQGQWDQGIAILQPFIHAHPHDPKALNLMGIALTGKGNLAHANERYMQALKVDPRFYPALKNLAVNEFTQKDLAASERDFDSALKMAPDDAVIRTYLGEIAYRRDDYPQAATHLAKAGHFVYKDPRIALHLAKSYLEIQQAPRALETLSEVSKQGLNPRLQFEAGLILAQHNLFQEAIPYFGAVREGFPDSYDTDYNLSLCYVETKQNSQAIDLLEELSRKGHKTAELANLLAHAYEGDHQTEKALQALREATLVAPKDEKNYLDLGVMCLNHDSFELGLQAVEVGLHHLPDSDQLVFQRGVFHAMLGQYESAERDFQLANKLAPERDLTYAGLGMTYLQEGHLPEAIRVLRQRTKEARGHGDYHLPYLLGEALIRSGVTPGQPAFAEARSALEESLRLSPTYSRSHVDLAKLYLMENRLDEAIDHFEKARALDPENKAVYSHLATAYRRKGKSGQANAMLAMLVKLNDQDRAHVYPVSKLMKGDLAGTLH